MKHFDLIYSSFDNSYIFLQNKNTHQNCGIMLVKNNILFIFGEIKLVLAGFYKRLSIANKRHPRVGDLGHPHRRRALLQAQVK